MLHVDSFGQLLREAGGRFGKAPFLTADPILGAVSYEDVLRFAVGFEKQLEALGVPAGAHVATLFHNCGIAALLFLATIASRRVLVPLNPRSTQYELEYVLDRAACRVVFVDPEHCNHADSRAFAVTDHREFFARCVAEGEHAAA